MTISLSELQNRFADELRYKESTLDNPCMIESTSFTSDERLQIYRNNFVIGLSEVLEATYPVIKALVGDECFQALSREHVLTNALSEGDVTHFGERFERTIASIKTVSEPLPYLVDIARLEYALDRSNNELAQALPSPMLKPLNEISDVPEDQQDKIVLHLKHGTFSLNSDYSVYSIYNGVISGQLENISIDKPESVLIRSTANNELDVTTISTTAFRLILSIRANKPLNQIEPSELNALPEISSFDVLSGFTLTNQTQD
ncbi:DNA-binding domain-containing protein [Vibrio sp. HN007]|uniref:HvfC/BufC N-terminal domain-containing protein n=1 Tax=Vibrio iocasae TaxID=3098914 RepID=UPI0035D481B4